MSRGAAHYVWENLAHGRASAQVERRRSLRMRESGPWEGISTGREAPSIKYGRIWPMGGHQHRPRGAVH